MPDTGPCLNTRGDPLTDIVVKGTKQTYAKCPGLVYVYVCGWVCVYVLLLIDNRRPSIARPGHRSRSPSRLQGTSLSCDVASCKILYGREFSPSKYFTMRRVPHKPFRLPFSPLFPILILMTDSLISSKSILAKISRELIICIVTFYNF